MSGTVTRFVWRGGHVVYETDGNGTITISYTWGMGTDDLIAIHRHSDGAHRYVVQDKLRSVRGLVDRNGTWMASWRYRAYGTQLDSAGADAAAFRRFRWAGAQYDEETGFYFLRSRYYDPGVGRFVQEDKIGRAGGVNLYHYAGGAPLAARDPSGHTKSEDGQYDYFMTHWNSEVPFNNCWNHFHCDYSGFKGGGGINESFELFWFAMRNGYSPGAEVEWEIWRAQNGYDERQLTAGEKKALGTMCTSGEIDCDAVYLAYKPRAKQWTRAMSVDKTMIRFNGAIASDMSADEGDLFWLAHEMTHIWQATHTNAIAYQLTGLWTHVKAFLGADVYSADGTRPFGQQGMEQQAHIVGLCISGVSSWCETGMSPWRR